MKTERIIYLVIVLIISVAAAYLLNDRGRLRAELASCQEWAATVETTLADTIKATPVDTVRPITPTACIYPFLTRREIDSLRGLGLKQPLEDLERDLRRQTDLIPYEGVLGGTMGFHAPDGIRILGPGRAIGVFDDGHKEGHLILAFEVKPGGDITWEVIGNGL